MYCQNTQHTTAAANRLGRIGAAVSFSDLRQRPLAGSREWNHLTRPGPMPRGGDTSNAMIRCLCSVLLHPLHDPGVPRRCGPFARPLIGRPAQAASAAANPRAGPAARQAGRCKLSSAGTPPFGSTPAAEGMRACDWARRWHALGFTTKRHVKAAQSRTCMPCANQPSSMSSSVVPVRLRPEHSSAIHLPAVPFRIGSCAASGRRVAAKVAASAALQVSPLTPVRPVPGLWSGLVWSGLVVCLVCLTASPPALPLSPASTVLLSALSHSTRSLNLAALASTLAHLPTHHPPARSPSFAVLKQAPRDQARSRSLSSNQTSLGALPTQSHRATDCLQTSLRKTQTQRPTALPGRPSQQPTGAIRIARSLTPSSRTPPPVLFFPVPPHARFADGFPQRSPFPFGAPGAINKHYRAVCLSRVERSQKSGSRGDCLNASTASTPPLSRATTSPPFSTMATVSRQPFAPVDGARLKSLASVKNRQNGMSLLVLVAVALLSLILRESYPPPNAWILGFSSLPLSLRHVPLLAILETATAS